MRRALVVMVAGGWAMAMAGGCTPPVKPSSGEATDLRVEATDLEELEDPQAVVVEVDGEVITREEVQGRIDGLVEFARVRVQTGEQRDAFLERIVEFEAMADVAEEQGYGAHVRTRWAMKASAATIYLEEVLAREVSMADIDDRAKREYFEANREDFFRPERRRLARLVVDEEEQAQRLLQRWHDEELPGAERVDSVFRRFAYYHSRDRATGDHGGVVGWWSAGEEPEPSQPIFDWEFQQVYGPFEEDGSWALKMVIEREETFEPTLEEVEQEVTTRIFEERRAQAREQMVAALVADATVEVLPQRLEGLKPERRAVPPRLSELPRQPQTIDDQSAEDDESAGADNE